MKYYNGSDVRLRLSAYKAEEQQINATGTQRNSPRHIKVKRFIRELERAARLIRTGAAKDINNV